MLSSILFTLNKNGFSQKKRSSSIIINFVYIWLVVEMKNEWSWSPLIYFVFTSPGSGEIKNGTRELEIRPPYTASWLITNYFLSFVSLKTSRSVVSQNFGRKPQCYLLRAGKMTRVLAQGKHSTIWVKERERDRWNVAHQRTGFAMFVHTHTHARWDTMEMLFPALLINGKQLKTFSRLPCNLK